MELLTGKLKYHCPALFSSLLLWERDSLDTSNWLKTSTSKVDVSTVVYRGIIDPDGVGTERQKDRVTLLARLLGVETISIQRVWSSQVISYISWILL
jgi:hypothetical protein